ncbi:MAG: ABC transporter permease [Gemmatimonadales bacterium]|nr:ABC transporter permease [Gemmatimonadales bacterium]
MKRLVATVRRDLKLLYRNGFFHAAAVVAGILILVLRALPPDFAAWLLPLALLGNFVTNGFYFAAGMMLLEKAERTLDVQFATPLRSAEYVGAKIVALSLLTLVETGVIVVASGHSRYLLLGLSTVALTAVLGQLGLLMVTRYRSINEFLMPSVLVMYAVMLPAVDLLGLWDSALLYFHPLYPPMVLLEAAFRPVSGLETVVALVLTAAWIAVGMAISQRVIGRFATTP